MSGLFNRMFRAARRTARQAWGVVTGVTNPVVQFCRNRWPWSWKKTLLYLTAGGLFVAAAWVLSPYYLPLLGFTPNGIAGGSFAAWIQSAVYGAYTAAPFSFFQSAGATAVTSAGAAIVGILTSSGSIATFVVARRMQ
ncbi:hypothetical protein BKA70DRAFT_1339681 [Coprinopsis sp. MPI-PUGE-AT-0042]|nr:hypothetical protein BKA70DRAFT_1339681 [Coprinopsis sp. MPI-PUGE-AT-0042]